MSGENGIITLARQPEAGELAAALPVLALAAFTFVFFAGLLWHLFRPGAAERMEEAARMPLDGDRPLHYWRFFGRARNRCGK
jgi:cbb3-type cytochrome oxidase subunit 3